MFNFFLTFCALFPLFISNTSIVRINFGANLDAPNAGNDISGIQISKIFWGLHPQTPQFMRGILATHVAFSHCYPPLIYYLTERSLFKKCPPTGKSLKKALPTLAVQEQCLPTNFIPFTIFVLFYRIVAIFKYSGYSETVKLGGVRIL